MTIHLSIVLFLPLAAGLLGAVLPPRIGRWAVLAGALLVLGSPGAVVAGFHRGGGAP